VVARQRISNVLSFFSIVYVATCSFVNIRPKAVLVDRRPAINIAVAFQAPGGGRRPTSASSSLFIYINNENDYQEPS